MNRNYGNVLLSHDDDPFEMVRFGADLTDGSLSKNAN